MNVHHNANRVHKCGHSFTKLAYIDDQIDWCRWKQYIPYNFDIKNYNQKWLFA